MLVSQLSKSIANNIEDLEVLKKIYDGKYSVEEAEADLSKVNVINLPKENIWCFQSEIQDIDCLRNENNTVECTILHLNGRKLYAYMIELKSGLSKKNIGGLKKKFTCSLVTLTLYLSSHPHFSSLDNVEIFPIGVTCFNENTYQIHYKSKAVHYSPLQKTVHEFNPKNDFHKTSARLKPITLIPMAIPILFFQNPDWMPTPPNTTNEFTIDFKRFLT